MVKTRRKGNRVQLKAIKELQAEGYLVSKLERLSKYESTDCFGLFDLIAKKKDITRWIQITGRKPHTHKDYLRFSEEFISNESYEQWCWHDRHGWKKFTYFCGKKMMEDTRKMAKKAVKKCPGDKIKSKGKGRGKAVGKGKGPVGRRK